MEKDEFERKVNSEAKASYSVKTTAHEILAAHENRSLDKPAKKTPRVALLASLYTIAASLLLLSIVIPLAVANFTPHSSEDSGSSSGPVNPVDRVEGKAKATSLVYEVSSVSSVLLNADSPLKTAFAHPVISYNETTFEETVSTYEKMQEAAYRSFYPLADATIQGGSFLGYQATYPYCLTLGDGLLFYFNLDMSDEYKSGKAHGVKKESFEGEIVHGDDYFLVKGSSRASNNSAASKVSLTIFLNTDQTTYYDISQGTNGSGNGSADYFRIAHYETGSFAYSYSVVSIDSPGAGKFANLTYATLDDEAAPVRSFRVEKTGEEAFSIDQDAYETIALLYQSGKRIYSTSLFSKTL